MKFITPSFHGILDYIVDITLIFIPILFDFGAISNTVLYLPVALGLSNFIYSLLTMYGTSIVPLLPFRIHLVLDFLVGIILFTSSFVLNVEGFPNFFLIAMGIGICAAVVFTKLDNKKEIIE